MTREFDDTREQRKRETESPAHKKRRQSKQTLDYYESITDLEELSELFDDDEVETFEPIRHRR